MSTVFDPSTQPIEALVERSLAGELSFDAARALAAQSAFGERITSDDVTSLVAMLQKLSQADMHTAATLAAEFLLLALEARTTDASSEADLALQRDRAALAWTRTVTASLGTQPDWRRFASARVAGERVLARGRAESDDELTMAAHRELAKLHLHPLLANVSSRSNWRVMTEAWYARGDAATPNAAERYPEPSLAWSCAAEHAKQWGALNSGRIRGLALSNYVTAREWQTRCTDTHMSSDDLADAAYALTLLDPLLDVAEITYLLGIRQEYDKPLDVDRLQAVLAVPLSKLIETIGAENTVNTRANLAQLILPIDATLALAIIENAAPAVVAAQSAVVLERHSNVLLTILFAQMADGTEDPAGPVLEAARTVIARSQQESWSPIKAAGVLLTIAARAHQTEEEGEALILFDMAQQLSDDPFNAYPAAFQFFRITLWSGAAVNAVRRKEWMTALQGYAAAFKLALPLGFHDFSLQQFKNFADAAVSGGEAVRVFVLSVLLEQSLPLQFQLGTDAIDLLQWLTLRLTEQQLAEGDISDELLHQTWRVAKARRYGAAWRAGAATQLRAISPEIVQVLGRIHALSAQVPLADQASGPGSQIARDRRLLAFVRSDLPSPGETAVEQLANLQHRFDVELEQHTAAIAGVQPPTVLSLKDIRESLDARTVVVQLFLGQHDEKRAVTALLTSISEVSLSTVPDAEPLMRQFAEGARRELAYSYEEDVFLTREAILRTDISDEELARYLHAAGGAFLHGSVGKALDRLHQAGCNHLIFIPHGPYHFAPLHLFARQHRLLADEWTVTVVPSVELLMPSPKSAERRTGLASFGLDFEDVNPFGLPTLAGASDEASRVAASFCTEATLNSDATRHALFEALESGRYVHLATHGALNLDAPAFQMLVMAPDAANDGIVNAHELLRLDLRGLELVTLSACESALGRVDRADNPRGLPAALLLAGAETVIGTLWEVASDTSRAFFVALYQSLALGHSRRESFRTAQIDIRARFPDARDWAAFYFMGASF